MPKLKPAGLRSLKSSEKVKSDGKDGLKKLLNPLVIFRKVFGVISFVGHALTAIDKVKDWWDDFF